MKRGHDSGECGNDVAPNTPPHCSEHTSAPPRGLFCPGGCPIILAPEKSEGAGNAGCPLHPRPVCEKSAHGSHHRYSGSPGVPCAMVLTALRRALPGDEFVLSPSPANWRRAAPGWAKRVSARLDTSNGCQDHTVLPSAATAICTSTSHVPARRNPRRRICRRSSRAKVLLTEYPPCEQTRSRPTQPRPPHPTPRS